MGSGQPFNLWLENVLGEERVRCLSVQFVNAQQAMNLLGLRALVRAASRGSSGGELPLGWGICVNGGAG